LILRLDLQKVSVSDNIAADRTSKKQAITALGALVLLLIGAVIYFRERMLFADASAILFKIINSGQIEIVEHRYGSFITQLFPYLAVKLHLSLEIILLLYSVSFNLFYLGVAVLLVYKYRQYASAILLALYLTLFVSDAYFWTNDEIHQGIAWLLLAFAITETMAIKGRSLLFSIPAFILLFGLAISTHPLVLIVASYLWFLAMMDKKRWPFSKQMSWVYSVVLLGLCFAKYHYGAHHGYDSGKIEFISTFKISALKTFFSWPFVQFFLAQCLRNYWIAVLLFLAGIVTLIGQRRYLQLLFTLAYSVGYILIVGITFHDINDATFYLESEYMILAIMVSAPFVYYALPRMKVSLAVGVLAVVFLVRLAYIYNAAPLFKTRLSIINSISSKMGDKSLTKLVITGGEQLLDKQLMITWCAPAESMILSRLSGAVPQRTFIIQNSDEIHSNHTERKDELLGPIRKMNAGELNARYFSIDTTSVYQMIDYDQLMK